MPTWTYRPSLDGLRMLSMYLIVLYHAGVPWLRGSFVAVDLFFVLSGFLVTQVVLAEVDRTGRLSLRDFYARRVRRLMPAALVAIVGTALLLVLVAPVSRRLDVIADGQAALLYVANWRYLLTSNDYFAADGASSPFLHYWTLSIEEQFYVAFPLLLVLLLKAGRRWALPVGLGVLFVLSVAAQSYWGVVDPIHAYYGTDARAYQLLAGALLALAMRHRGSLGLGPRSGALVATGGLVVFLLLTPTSWIEVSQSVRGFVATAAIVGMILGLMVAERQPLGWLLSRRWIVYLGTITYATYLWHWPLVLVLDDVLVVRPEVLAVLVAIAATALAAASNELLEQPVRRSKALARHAWPVVATGVAACVVAALVVVPQVLDSERRPVLAAGTSGGQVEDLESVVASEQAGRGEGRRDGGDGTRSLARLDPIPDDIDWRAVSDDTGTPVTCAPDEPDGCVVRRGDGPHVLLVGDSHAMMLSDAFRELAEERDLTLSMNIVSSCPWQEDLANAKFGDNLTERCTEARRGWYGEALPALDPDLVVMVARPRDDDGWRDLISSRSGRTGTLEELTWRASRETVREVRSTGARVALVEQVTVPETFEPQECLGEAKRSIECAVAVPQQPAVSNAYFTALAADDGGVHSVSLQPALCPGAPVCAPVVDGQVVWRDKAHVTARFATRQRELVWEALPAAR